MQQQPAAGDGKHPSEKDGPRLAPPGFFSPEIRFRRRRHRGFKVSFEAELYFAGS
tara:strand:+ start:216 stop:380 length:165 start_codon:yes stop_codon:yes gene_type:complete